MVHRSVESYGPAQTFSPTRVLLWSSFSQWASESGGTSKKTWEGRCVFVGIRRVRLSCFGGSRTFSCLQKNSVPDIYRKTPFCVALLRFGRFLFNVSAWLFDLVHRKSIVDCFWSVLSDNFSSFYCRNSKGKRQNLFLDTTKRITEQKKIIPTIRRIHPQSDVILNRLMFLNRPKKINSTIIIGSYFFS